MEEGKGGVDPGSDPEGTPIIGLSWRVAVHSRRRRRSNAVYSGKRISDGPSVCLRKMFQKRGML
jgi:hypothetical protein